MVQIIFKNKSVDNIQTENMEHSIHNEGYIKSVGTHKNTCYLTLSEEITFNPIDYVHMFIFFSLRSSISYNLSQLLDGKTPQIRIKKNKEKTNEDLKK